MSQRDGGALRLERADGSAPLGQAPEWQTTTWLNSQQPLSLAALRGKVVLMHAFQMLCPGCVSHGIPQAERAAELFAGTGLVVLGLHTVFEHHEAMGEVALRAFLHEYRVTFPVGIDAPGPSGDPLPRTMRNYGMRGTPTTLLFDSLGGLRRSVFGVHEDMLLGAEISALLMETGEGGSEQERVDAAATAVVGPCTDQGCAVG